MAIHFSWKRSLDFKDERQIVKQVFNDVMFWVKILLDFGNFRNGMEFSGTESPPRWQANQYQTNSHSETSATPYNTLLTNQKPILRTSENIDLAIHLITFHIMV